MADRITTPRKKQPRKKRVTFTLHAPEAQTVHLAGTFCDWQTSACALKKDRKGLWKTTLSLAPGRYEYRFLVDGQWRDDPTCNDRIPTPFGSHNCVLHVVGEEL